MPAFRATTLLRPSAPRLLLWVWAILFAVIPPAAAADPSEARALPDVPLGQADAPFTVVEFASLTCTHCAEFHRTVFPVLLKDYVETGKARFILREFPRDPLDFAGFMLARCGGPAKRNAIIDLLYDKQQSWAFTATPLADLEAILRQTGMSQVQAETCLADQKGYDALYAQYLLGVETYHVSGTPTFFVNGKRIEKQVRADNLADILSLKAN